ncbi:MAG: hypothetical protein GX197_00720 [Firmicutes bacterium]|nr:hypothetical protein [Bacillota bacterium]
MQKSYHGLATGVGSFPYQDPAQALEVIFTRVPQIPHWPQLPQKGNHESMGSSIWHLCCRRVWSKKKQKGYIPLL